jgi:bifunctional DNase/RNase
MLVPAEVWTVAKAEQGSAVLIKPIGSEVAVPIFIGPLEAHAILIGMTNHKMPRPLTHDLLISTLEQLGTKISRIEITELKEGTFYGRLVLGRAGEDIVLDSRPSDCVALAVRAKCPIFIDEAVVDEAGIPITAAGADKEAEGTTRASEVQAQIAFLQKELEKAVDEENYEQAASLRDQIKKLETRL